MRKRRLLTSQNSVKEAYTLHRRPKTESTRDLFLSWDASFPRVSYPDPRVNAHRKTFYERYGVETYGELKRDKS